MIKRTLPIVLLLACTVLPLQAVAQQATAPDVEIQDVDGLRLQIARHTQDPHTKEVRLSVVLFSKITSDRVVITWSVSGDSRLISPVTPVEGTIPVSGATTLSVVPNQSYVTSAVILPSAKAVANSRILARVEAFKADGTYLSTASMNVNALAGDIFPVTTQYNIAKIILLLRGIAVGMLAVIFAYLAATFAYKKFTLWYSRDT